MEAGKVHICFLKKKAGFPNRTTGQEGNQRRNLQVANATAEPEQKEAKSHIGKEHTHEELYHYLLGALVQGEQGGSGRDTREPGGF